MSKPKKIQIPGKPYFAWEYEEQTQIKHKVLGAYSKIWISKLGWKSNTLFFDCHGGCGAYIDNGNISYGSSIIVHNVAKELNSKRNFKTWILYCENDKNNYNNFVNVAEDNNITNTKAFNMPFEDAITKPKIKTLYEKNPTLFLVDPFGYNFDINFFETINELFRQ